MSKAAYNVYAAGGAATPTPTYIEDVFSTYLYTGNGSGLEINNGIALGNSLYGPSVALNGTTDYLSKSSDLTGAADGKTFTFSAWVYITGTGSDYRIYHSNDTGSGWPRFAVFVNCSSTSSATVTFVSYPTDGTKRLDVRSPVGAFVRNGWNHILASFDMASQANSKMYINDVSVALTVDTFVDIALSFSNNEHYVGAESSSAGKLAGRISNVYLDYTYRNLTVEANRRLFRTSTGQPATGQASLSPILYMPFDGTTAIGVNSGTGGNFTVNGSPTALTENGPYLATGVGKGGLVWFKSRGQAANHRINDTSAATAIYKLAPNTTAALASETAGLLSFNTNGFTIGADGTINTSSDPVVSWTFREQAKFFDIVTYTGTGVERTIAHNLGSVPGCIIVKRRDGIADWQVYHRSLANTQFLLLNQADAVATGTYWNDTTPTSSVFSVGTDAYVNASGGAYVAYLFAHNAGGFGLTGNDNVISCGSTNGTKVTLGYEPQWILYKSSNFSGAWELVDNMRGLPVGAVAQLLKPNTTGAETTTSNSITIAPDGFTLGAITGTAIYIAIRRGPMKVPTVGTTVFTPTTRTGDGTTGVVVTNANFPIDLAFGRGRSTSAPTPVWIDRLRGATRQLRSDNSDAEAASTIMSSLASQTGWIGSTGGSGSWNTTSVNYIQWYIKRAPSFFDVVCYTGNDTAGTNITHNLGVTPELMIVKNRSEASSWIVYASALGSTKFLILTSDSAAQTQTSIWNNTAPTATQFTLGNSGAVNQGSPGTPTFVWYGFATCPGVSKVGSYTGNGSTQTIDCGFAAGGRFVLIKRTDSAGDWYTFDTARGIIAGNDPFLKINTTTAETTSYDAVDPANSGFIVNNDDTNFPVNVSSATYIFLAIA